MIKSIPSYYSKQYNVKFNYDNGQSQSIRTLRQTSKIELFAKTAKGFQ